MLKALESVLAVLVMIGLGFFLARRGRIGAEAASLLSRLVVSIALPAYMVANLMSGYDRAKIIAMLPGLPVPFLVMLAGFALGQLIAAAARIPASRRGSFVSMFALSNTIFIGLPVNLVLFGDVSLPYVLLYYIANTTLFWTIGVYGIARDGAIRSGGPAPRVLSKDSLRRVLSPPLVAFLVTTVLIMAGLRLPDFLLGIARTVGNMTTPLSMIFIGITIAAIDWKSARPGMDAVLLLVGRFVISPLLLVLAVKWSDLPSLMKRVFLIQASMPAMTQSSIVARAYGADAEYAGLLTSITTVASLVTIPLYMALIGQLF
ncbi:MAG TPA: AEC family transporter [Rectinemataceae bacterium]|nr:AEC family transporter [Rectinemataceae bacterium]